MPTSGVQRKSRPLIHIYHTSHQKPKLLCILTQKVSFLLLPSKRYGSTKSDNSLLSYPSLVIQPEQCHSLKSANRKYIRIEYPDILIKLFPLPIHTRTQTYGSIRTFAGIFPHIFSVPRNPYLLPVIFLSLSPSFSLFAKDTEKNENAQR